MAAAVRRSYMSGCKLLSGIFFCGNGTKCRFSLVWPKRVTGMSFCSVHVVDPWRREYSLGAYTMRMSIPGLVLGVDNLEPVDSVGLSLRRTDFVTIVFEYWATGGRAAVELTNEQMPKLAVTGTGIIARCSGG